MEWMECSVPTTADDPVISHLARNIWHTKFWVLRGLGVGLVFQRFERVNLACSHESHQEDGQDW